MSKSPDIRPIPGFKGYFASESGDIYSEKRGPRKKLHPRVTSTGYQRVDLSRGKKRHVGKVHVLVCSTFHGPRPGNPREIQATHKDGNKLNNAASNLRWAFRSANEADKKIHGRSNAGERNGRASLSEKVVKQIKGATGTQQQIARRFDVSRSTVSDIRRGRSWKCLDDRAGEDVTFVLPDLHIPYHLPKELAACLRLAQSVGPKRIVLIGDVIDCMTISRFDKNPARKATLADEINAVRKFLRDLRLRFPDAEMHYCEGNHEDRLRKYLWRKSPELSGLTGLSVPDLLHLSDLKIAWQSRGVRIGKVTYTHGNRIRKLAGQTARTISDELVGSILCGHSHRQGRCPRTTPAGMYDAYEVGCLCDYRLLDYVDSVPNWQLGAATVTTFGDGNFAVDFVTIVDGKVFWRGRCVDKVK